MLKNDKNSLRIWILQDGEQLPLVNGAKPMRSWRLGEELSKRGHEVIWWSSNFNHMKKEKVCEGDCDYKINDHFTLKLLEAGTYLKNISISRIKHHKKLGERYKSEARKMPKPDVIIASHPIVEFSYEGTQYGKENNVPVIVDVRDMWPDIFQDYFPKIFRPFINAATYFMRKKARYAFSSANAVISMSKDVLDWALKVSKLKNFSDSEVFFLSCEKIEGHSISTKKILDIKEKYANKTIISFIGTFGKTYELKTICEAAKAIKIKNPSLLFILAGDGENFKDIEKLSRDSENILLTGWLNREECKDLMSLTDIGLVPSNQTAIPNKFVEILSAGKPMLSSGIGVIVDLISSFKVGASYKSGDSSSLLSALDSLLKNKLYQSMGQNCINLFDAKFNAKKIYKEYADYVEIIEKKQNNLQDY